MEFSMIFFLKVMTATMYRICKLRLKLGYAKYIIFKMRIIDASGISKVRHDSVIKKSKKLPCSWEGNATQVIGSASHKQPLAYSYILWVHLWNLKLFWAWASFVFRAPRRDYLEGIISLWWGRPLEVCGQGITTQPVALFQTL